MSAQSKYQKLVQSWIKKYKEEIVNSMKHKQILGYGTLSEHESRMLVSLYYGTYLKFTQRKPLQDLESLNKIVATLKESTIRESKVTLAKEMIEGFIEYIKQENFLKECLEEP